MEQIKSRYGFLVRMDGIVLAIYGPYATFGIALNHRKILMRSNYISEVKIGAVSLYDVLAKNVAPKIILETEEVPPVNKEEMKRKLRHWLGIRIDGEW